MKKPIEKKCTACNTVFYCNAHDIDNCDCKKIKVNENQLLYLKNKFTDCICSNCLLKFSSIKNATIIHLVIMLFLLLHLNSYAQFHGMVGSANTNAIHKDSSVFVAWAKTCTVTRGWQHIANTSLGFANVGVDSNGVGKAGENPIVSLGDGGTAILTFDRPIKNGLGYDFAVFENAFSNHFLELAFVEVSSDGINYFRFPATSNMQYTTQIGPYDELGEPEKINNLAGKYRVNYGTPFDLEELKNKPGLNVNAITHIKIIDVVGCVQAPYASHDDNFSIINDPYPTDFGNGGFDLDAVGVIYQQEVGLNESELLNTLYVYPNPCNTNLNIVNTFNGEKTIVLFNQLGEEKINVSTNSININLNLSELNKGLYHLKINSERGVIFKKILIN